VAPLQLKALQANAQRQGVLPQAAEQAWLLPVEQEALQALSREAQQS
jgi:hypothetical protein